MTLEEFKLHVRDYRRFELLRGVLFFSLLFSMALPTVLIARRADNVGFDAVAIAVTVVSCIVVTALMFYVVARMGRKRLNRSQGECPACGRFLIGKYSHVVMKRGQCPRCNSQILQAV